MCITSSFPFFSFRPSPPLGRLISLIRIELIKTATVGSCGRISRGRKKHHGGVLIRPQMARMIPRTIVDVTNVHTLALILPSSRALKTKHGEAMNQ